MISNIMRTVLAGVICCMVGAQDGIAQPSLMGGKRALGIIVEQSKLADCPDGEQLRASVKADADFLNEKNGQAGWGKAGKDYVSSLNDLADALQNIAHARKSMKACETFRLIARDLHTKRLDCEALGHGRTDVPVEVTTIAGRNPIPGLEVYTRWLPAGDRFSTTPKRLAGLSTPARGTVPIPGEFEIFARDPSSGKSTQPERVSIGGAEVFQWQLPVAFQASPARK